VNQLTVEHQPQGRKAVNKPSSAFAPRPTRAEFYAMGEKLRKKCSRTSHADWKPSNERPHPVQLVEEGDKGRIPQLVPREPAKGSASRRRADRGA
jgi:hypothetical protein